VAEGRHELLDVFALALRTGYFLVSEDEGLEGFLALLASILENRHMKNPSLVLLPWWEEEVEEGENPLPSIVC